MKTVWITFWYLLFAIHLFAQSSNVSVREYQAERISTETIQIDGMLDEQAWVGAVKSGNYTQFDPHEGIAPTFDTEFALLFDKNNLYVGIRAWDPFPDSISTRMSRRDDIEGDIVGIDFDSYHDHRTAFGFWVSAGGVKMDRIITGDGNSEDPSWDPNWLVKTHIDELGWTAEMKIPLSQLRFDNASMDGWGVNLMRYIFRRDEASIWQRIPKGSGGFVSYYGHLTGLNDLKPARLFDLTPYTVASLERLEAEEGNPYNTGKSHSFTVGLDSKIGLTNNLTLDVSVNPDFGQVEADPSEVNLTAYETFFQEKRPFFIEGRNILSMPLMIGDGDMANENLFYTRRIGRRPQGRAQMEDGAFSEEPSFTKIIGAAKITGKSENGWSVGLLESLTSAEYASIVHDGEERQELIEPMTNYLVGSVGKDFNEGNTVIKGVVTSVNRQLEPPLANDLHQSAYSAGFDFSQLLKNKTYLISVKTYFSLVQGSPEALLRTQTSSVHYYQRPDATHLQLDSTRSELFGNGGSIMFGKVGNSKFNGGIFLNWKTPGVELNDMGYIRSSDELFPILWASYQFYEPFGIFRSLRFNSSLWNAFDFSYRYLATGASLNTNASFTNYWKLSLGISTETESLSTGMLRGGPAFLTPGSIRPWIFIGTDSRKKWMLNFNFFSPTSFQGHAQTWGGKVALIYRPWNNLQVALEPNFMSQTSNLQYITEKSYAGNARYIFGTLEQSVLGLSVRVNLTITPELTIQYWGQPFIASGKYQHIKRISDPTAGEYADRFHVFSEDEIIYSDSEGYIFVDENQDQIGDYSVAYPDFNLKEFKSNLVARWEFRPGSIFYLVWSQGRSVIHGYGDLDVSRDFNSLYSDFPHNIFLLKFSYRFGL